jgi:hypothetical protein
MSKGQRQHGRRSGHLGEQRRDDRKIIADAMDKVGKDGVITVEEARPRTRSMSSKCSSTAAICRPIS